MNRKTKIAIVTFSILAALGILFAIVWNTRVFGLYGIKKASCVQTFLTPEDQVVFTVGTIHGKHFDKANKYSMADIKSLLKYVQPDYVYIESRPETFVEYGALDGPIEMLYIYSYCQENRIPVAMIDWWEENDQSKSNTTTVERDDHIFANICRNLKDVKANKKVMIFYGTKHFYDQMPRMTDQGWTAVTYGNPEGYFYYSNQDFEYPQSLPKLIEDKIDYLKNIEVEVCNENIKDQKVRTEFIRDLYSLCDTLDAQKNLVKLNRLYK